MGRRHPPGGVQPRCPARRRIPASPRSRARPPTASRSAPVPPPTRLRCPPRARPPAGPPPGVRANPDDESSSAGSAPTSESVAPAQPQAPAAVSPQPAAPVLPAQPAPSRRPRWSRSRRSRCPRCRCHPSAADGGVDVAPERFEELVGEALDELPGELTRAMDNVVVLVEDRHPEEPDLLGLYDGVALTERDRRLRRRAARPHHPLPARARRPLRRRGRAPRGGGGHRGARGRPPLRHRRGDAARLGWG